MNEHHTEIVVVLDRSGSMQSIRKDMEGGLNTFLEEQKKEPGRCSVTLTQFDTEYEVLYSGKDLNDVPKVELVPRGGTALLDALGRTINVVGKRLSDTPEADRPGRVLFLIITDGMENASHEFDSATIKKMVEHQTKKYQWQFVYLGANQDAFAEAGKLGVQTSTGYVADAAGTGQMLGDMSKAVRSYRGGGGYHN